DRHARVGGGDVGVAAEVVVVEGEVPHRVAVVAAEPVAPVVLAAAVLRLAGRRLQLAGVRPDAQVVAAEGDGPPHPPPLSPAAGGAGGGIWAPPAPRGGGGGGGGGRTRRDGAAAVAVGDVDPVVEPPHRAVDAVLLVALDEAAVERDALVGLAVAVGVLGVEDLRGTRHDDALAPGHDAGWEADAFEEDGRLVVLAVATGGFEEL